MYICLYVEFHQVSRGLNANRGSIERKFFEHSFEEDRDNASLDLGEQFVSFSATRLHFVAVSCADFQR